MNNQTKEQVTTNQLLEFVEYVDSFYNPVSGLYPIAGANVAVITQAIKTYLVLLQTDSGQTWGDGDSVDRERVRTIILEMLGLSMAKAKPLK